MNPVKSGGGFPSADSYSRAAGRQGQILVVLGSVECGILRSTGGDGGKTTLAVTWLS